MDDSVIYTEGTFTGIGCCGVGGENWESRDARAASRDCRDDSSCLADSVSGVRSFVVPGPHRRSAQPLILYYQFVYTNSGNIYVIDM